MFDVRARRTARKPRAGRLSVLGLMVLSACSLVFACLVPLANGAVADPAGPSVDGVSTCLISPTNDSDDPNDPLNLTFDPLFLQEAEDLDPHGEDAGQATIAPLTSLTDSQRSLSLDPPQAPLHTFLARQGLMNRRC